MFLPIFEHVYRFHLHTYKFTCFYLFSIVFTSFHLFSPVFSRFFHFPIFNSFHQFYSFSPVLTCFHLFALAVTFVTCFHIFYTFPSILTNLHQCSPVCLTVFPVLTFFYPLPPVLTPSNMFSHDFTSNIHETFKVLGWPIFLLVQSLLITVLKGDSMVGLTKALTQCILTKDLAWTFLQTIQLGTLSHLKSFLEPAVPPIRLFLIINMMPLMRCVVKGNYYTAL